jgi:8-oxo-dGTP diphosphatase
MNRAPVVLVKNTNNVMVNSKPVIKVAVAVILDANNQVLLSRRRNEVDHPGMLEFPGGKLESGESAEAALKRECLEELGIEVTENHYEFDVQYEYENKMVLLHIFTLKSYEGHPTGREGQAIGWHPVDQLDQNDFPAANAEIVDWLRKLDWNLF